MSFATEHADALASIGESGASVSFSHSVMTYDPITDAPIPTPVTVTGKAIRVKGEPQRYEELSLVESESPMLLFAPDTYGQSPPLGARVTWGGVTYTVRGVYPLAPDGTTILAKVMISS